MNSRCFLWCSAGASLVVAGVILMAGCGGEDGQPPRGSIVTPPRETAGAQGKGAEKLPGKAAPGKAASQRPGP
jgi:hypothetical protein